MQRQWEEPSVDRFREAFAAIRPTLSVQQLLMLEAHYLAPGHRVTSSELALAAGYTSHHPVNRWYSELGKGLRRALRLPLKEDGVHTGSFVQFPDKSRRDHWIFELKAPVVQALRSLGWFADSELDGGSEAELMTRVAPEGHPATVLRTHRHREQMLRRAKLRQVLQTRHRLVCEVPGCGFDFAATYGALGEKFTEVHHMLPLSAVPSVRMTTLDDLVIVCSNCHRMIHRGRQCLTLEQVGRAIAEQAGCLWTRPTSGAVCRPETT